MLPTKLTTVTNRLGVVWAIAGAALVVSVAGRT
jgi:hypothetical protein